MIKGNAKNLPQSRNLNSILLKPTLLITSRCSLVRCVVKKFYHVVQFEKKLTKDAQKFDVKFQEGTMEEHR